MVRAAGKLKKGETLVETIVSFAVVMTLMAFVLVIIRSAIALNNRSSALLSSLETSCTEVEADAGTTVSETASVVFGLSIDGANTSIQVPLIVKQAGTLTYFSVKETMP